jgi:hypothetical protein
MNDTDNSPVRMMTVTSENSGVCLSEILPVGYSFAEDVYLTEKQ